MTAETKTIREYTAEPLRPKMVFEGEEQVYDAAITAECPSPKDGEVALHLTRDGANGPFGSTYLTPSEAYILAERIRTCAWIAEQLGEPEGGTE